MTVGRIESAFLTDVTGTGNRMLIAILSQEIRALPYGPGCSGLRSRSVCLQQTAARPSHP